jgi:hypothetical protein
MGACWNFLTPGPWKQGGGRRGADLVVGTARHAAVCDARGAAAPMCARLRACDDWDRRKGERD